MVRSFSFSTTCALSVLVISPMLPSGTAAAAESELSATCGTYVAHRGEHSRWTENTLRAMKAAAALGADYVEVDVRETLDSSLVLMHNATIDRTTTSTGKVREMTMERLRKVTLNDGTTITPLSRNLDAIQDSSIQVMLEVKAITSELGFTRLAKQIRDFGVERIVVASFRTRLLDAVHALVPEVRRSLLTVEIPTFDKAVTYGSVSPHHSKLTQEWVTEMRAANYPVYAWTLNAARMWSKWNGHVAAITTDEAIDFAKWRATASCPEVTVP